MAKTPTKTKAAPAAKAAAPQGAADQVATDTATKATTDQAATTEGTADAAQAAEMEGVGSVAEGAGDAGTEAGGAGGGALGAADAVQAEGAELVAGAAPQGAAEAPAAATGDAVQAYRVLSPLDHDGEKLLPGRDVLLTADQAAPLLGHTVKPRSADDGPALQPPKGAAPQAEIERKVYRVLSPLDHDGKRRQVGAELALTEDEAAPLLGHTVALKDG